jgi:MFS family permease
MSNPAEGPLRASPAHRAASAVTSISTETPTIRRVDGDILSRIRSLLLARNGPQMPRTPYPSYERPDRGSEDSALNLVVIKKAAIANRREKRLSLPDSQRASTISGSPSMDIFGVQKYTDSEPSVPDHYPIILSSSSDDGAQLGFDPNAVADVSKLTDGPSTLPVQKKPRLRLVLADKAKPKEPELVSCVEISSNIPENDAKIHAEELPCCPPCSPPDSVPSKYVVRDNQWPKTVEAERSDLACFLAGCPPGDTNCSKHSSPRRAQSTSLLDQRSGPQDLLAIGKDPASDVDRIVTESRNRRSKSSKTDGHISVSKSKGGSAASGDAFPHAVQSQKVVARKSIQSPFSTTIFTNFNLPGPKSRRPSKVSPIRASTHVPPEELPRELVDIKPLEMTPLLDTKPPKKEPKLDEGPIFPRKRSETPIKPKKYTESVFSASSKTSKKRHALLKSSAPDVDPVDLRAPVPPVLSTIPSIADQLDSNLQPESKPSLEPERVEILGAEVPDTRALDPDLALSARVDKTLREVGPGAVANHLTNLQKTIELVDNVAQRVQNVKQNVQNGSADTSKRGMISPATEVNPVDAAYWGFGPAVKGAVEDAVQVAVRNVVQGAKVPEGVPKNQAAEVYRLLMADSLSHAAKNADEYLKRPSVWNSPGSSQSVQQVAPPSRAESIQRPMKIFQPGNDLETIPLDLNAIVSPENQKAGKPKPPNAIPDRGSSQNRVLSTKPGAANSLSNGPQSEREGRKDSFDLPVPKSAQAPPSVSASDLLKPFNPSTRYPLAESAISALPSRKALDPLDDRSFISNIPPARQLARKNTVHWLRELLSSKGPYEPQLTALPPRTRRGDNTIVNRARPQTAPLGTADIAYIKPGQEAEIDRAVIPENFTRTIDDLEQLLNEALMIAQLAAEKDDVNGMPAILGNAARILRNGRKELSEGYQPRRNNIRSNRTDTYSGEDSELGSIHESLRSFSVVTDSDIETDNERYAGHTPYVYRDQHGRSIEISPRNPPHRQTGKATLSRARDSVSRESMTADVPLMVGEENAERSKKAPIKGLPAENDFRRSMGKSSPIDDDQRPPEALGLLIGSGPPPEFYNPEPFRSPASTGTARRFPPERSPRRLSPTKQPAPTIVTNDQKSLPLPNGQSLSGPCRSGEHSEQDHDAVRTRLVANEVPTKREVREHIENFRNPPIHARDSSMGSRKNAKQAQSDAEGYQLKPGQTYDWQDVDQAYVRPCTLKDKRTTTLRRSVQYTSSMDGSEDSSGQLDFSVGYVARGAHSKTGARSTQQDTNKPQVIRASYDDRRYSRAPYDKRGVDSRQPDDDYPSRDINDNGGYQAGGGNGGGNGGRNGGGGYTPANPNDDGDDPNNNRPQGGYELRDEPDPDLPQTQKPRRRKRGNSTEFELKGKNHLSLRSDQHKGFSFAKSHKKPKIARDWKPARKRFCATVACISTALVGILVGIYAGEVPAIQYYIVDFHHYTVLGNVFFYLGLAIPTFFFWPLPLLHGRKHYILGSMALAMPLLFPQAVAVGSIRSPYVRYWRIALILPRALMGFCLGFANMNFKSTLTDLFGASLQSDNPHQEVVDENDVRRHGGGLGVWLGLWTWSAMGSIGLGFMIGAVIINHMPPAWGFYVSIFIIAGVLLLNIITPEVRRSAFRRSVAEVKDGEKVSRRIARGEVKMHMVQTGPKWWGEELQYGVILSMRMITQPGFLIMAIYVGWMYAQIVLIIIVSILECAYVGLRQC